MEFFVLKWKLSFVKLEVSCDFSMDRIHATGRQMRRKKCFWHKKYCLAKTSGKKKILLLKNRHLNITNLQLTSWITCLKSVADQLIHNGLTFR